MAFRELSKEVSEATSSSILVTVDLKRPATSSFASTALISLKLIYGSQLKVDYFNFDSTKISAKNNENLNGVYDYQNKFINSIKIEY